MIILLIRFGYVGNPITFLDTYSKTMTLNKYLKSKEKAYLNIDKIINHNLDMLFKVLKYNVENGIKFYRISSNIIPLATIIEKDFDYITPYINKWRKIGNYIKKHNLRVDMHPNQFCVLNSTKEDIVNNSIKELNYHLKMIKAMDIDSCLILHIGGGILDKEQALIRFKNVFKQLPLDIRDLIVLENDDKIFTLSDTIILCEELHIPFVFDYLHYLCNNKKEKLEIYFNRIINTWKEKKLRPKIHFSTSKSIKEKRSHSAYIDYKQFIKFLEKIKLIDCDIDIMLECKCKDEALFRLVRQLKLNGFKINKTDLIL